MSRVKTYFTTLNKTTLIKIIGLFIFFILAVLPVMSYWMSQVTGVSSSPDTNFNLSLSVYYSMRDSYEMIGRRLYIVQRFTFDLIWPFVYTIFLLAIIATFSKKFKWNDKLFIIPFIVIAFDFLENILASIFMIVFPDTVDTLLYVLMTATTLKWIFLGVLSIILIAEWIIILLSNKTKK